MMWATIFTIAIAFLLLKKRKVKEFFLFLAILFVILFPSFETFIESYVNLPLRKFFNYNHEATKMFFSSFPSIIKIIFLVISSISIAYFIYTFAIKFLLGIKQQEFVQTISNQTKHTPNKKIGFTFTFKKPNEKISA